MEELNFSLGVQEFKINGSRVIRFNPADIGFVDTVCSLGRKLDAIRIGTDKKAEKTNDPDKPYDYERLCDKRMREAMDAVFGEGFSKDVFQELRLCALSGGLMLYENFIYTILDKMNDSVMDNLSKRNGRIAQYTAKYTAKYKEARESRNEQPVA